VLRVAITRAAPENARTAERVRARGAEAILAPLLTITPRAHDTSTAGAQALLFTSTNGVRAFGGARELPVLTVGDATADAAREAGFTKVHSADGDVTALAALARSTLDPARGKLLHIAGDHVAGDLNATLGAAGFSVERRLAYASLAATALPAELMAPLDIVLFHSPRAAQTFVRLGAPDAAALTAACFSETVAEAARAAAWKSIIVAPAPREEALLDAALGARHSPAGASA